MATNEQMQAAYRALAAQYNNNVPWSVTKAFQDQWFPAVQQTQAARQAEIANPYAKYSSADPLYASYVDAYPDLAAAYEQPDQRVFSSKAAFGQYHYEKYGQGEGRNLNLAAENELKAQMEKQAAEFTRLQKEQEARAASLQQQLRQSQSQTTATPVTGVRTAGSKTTGGLQIRGASDAFRRSGMQIQSLNI